MTPNIRKYEWYGYKSNSSCLFPAALKSGTLCITPCLMGYTSDQSKKRGFTTRIQAGKEGRAACILKRASPCRARVVQHFLHHTLLNEFEIRTYPSEAPGVRSPITISISLIYYYNITINSTFIQYYEYKLLVSCNLFRASKEKKRRKHNDDYSVHHAEHPRPQREEMCDVHAAWRQGGTACRSTRTAARSVRS